MLSPLKLLDSLYLGSPHFRSVGRGIALAAAVGVVAGLGAVAFHALTQTVTHFALDALAGYRQGSPHGESELYAPTKTPLRPWLLVVVPMIGGLISGWLVYRFAPEAEGHGTDAAIGAYHRQRGLIRPGVTLVKMLSSAITLGTGGSGGREGPIAQIGAGVGSFVATRLGLSDAERRVLLAAGLGSGVGAIFHAPLAGAIFAVEVLYRDADFESEALIPAFISTTVAYCVFQSVLGALAVPLGLEFAAFEHLFSIAPDLRFRDPRLLLPLTGLVAVMVIASWAYVRCFYGVHGVFKRLKLRPWLKPMIGAGLTGLVALTLYGSFTLAGGGPRPEVLSVLSFGYGFLQRVVESTDGAGLSIALLLAVALGKLLTTSLTIGSGGSGGVFGPSMVIGGTLGAVVGLAGRELWPEVVQRIDTFVILGMAGFFAAAAKTPVSTLIMVSEMTGSYELLLPAMWVCALAYLFSRGWSIFREQVPTRLDSPAHRGDFVIDVLQGLTVSDALGPADRRFLTIPAGMPLSEVVRLITGTHQTCFPVVDEAGRYYGLFSLNDVRQFLYESDVGELAVAHDLATAGVEPLAGETDLGSAIGRFAAERFDELPVIDAAAPGKIIAMLRRQDVIAAYNAGLLKLRTAEPHA